MGACMSMRLGWQEHGSGSGSGWNSTAKVISLNGSLREYAAPVGVGEVLGAEKERAAAAAAAALLMCNSDSLYFDETVPAMDSQDELRPNQMYFVLSASKKEKPLSAADMASLAVKATKAMIITKSQSQSKSTNKKKKNSGRRQRRSSIISPLNIINDEEEYYHHPQEYHHELTVGVNITRKRDNKNNRSSSSRSTTTRAAKNKLMMPIPSFTLRLSTIYESS